MVPYDILVGLLAFSSASSLKSTVWLEAMGDTASEGGRKRETAGDQQEI